MTLILSVTDSRTVSENIQDELAWSYSSKDSVVSDKTGNKTVLSRGRGGCQRDPGDN